MRAHEFVKVILKNRQQTSQNTIGAAFAPTNIALNKYWGKRDNELNLPMTNSLSITLPEKGVFTAISFIDSAEDVFILNNHILSNETLFVKRLRAFLNLFRPAPASRFKIESTMNIPASAGLASSACGYAALVLALDDLFNWQLDKKLLSLLARLGSGSACRSLWPGFVQWHAGDDAAGMDSYAEPLTDSWQDLCIGLLIDKDDEKSISSRAAMQQTAMTSSYYSAWLHKTSSDLELIKTAIHQQNFALFGKTVESNALAMHASMLTAWPPISYWTSQTLETIQKIWQLRAEGLPVYFTQDAGPNIKLLFLASDIKDIQANFPSLELIRPFRPKELDNHVILVDESDRAIGSAEKISAHEQGLCHRAFSVFIFRQCSERLELLLQQRHSSKYHCGGLWTNTCCSHPRISESVATAAHRRLQEEMGIQTKLFPVGRFHYIAPFNNGLTENEIDHVWIGFYADVSPIRPDPQEVENYRWIEVAHLQEDLSIHPDRYTPWLAKALTLAIKGVKTRHVETVTKHVYESIL